MRVYPLLQLLLTHGPALPPSHYRCLRLTSPPPPGGAEPQLPAELREDGQGVRHAWDGCGSVGFSACCTTHSHPRLKDAGLLHDAFTRLPSVFMAWKLNACADAPCTSQRPSSLRPSPSPRPCCCSTHSWPLPDKPTVCLAHFPIPAISSNT